MDWEEFCKEVQDDPKGFLKELAGALLLGFMLYVLTVMMFCL